MNSNHNLIKRVSLNFSRRKFISSLVTGREDIEKLFTRWDQWAWHRVTFYGDLKAQAYDLADVLGWKVVEEA